MSEKKLLHVRVRDTENILYEGDAERINSYNEIGPFDVYPMHANFISIIKNKLAIYNNKQKVKELTFEQAIMKVKKDVVHIYLGIEVFLIEETENAKKTTTTSK